MRDTNVLKTSIATLTVISTVGMYVCTHNRLPINSDKWDSVMCSVDTQIMDNIFRREIRYLSLRNILSIPR